jgi:hypothetical protein
MEPIVWWCASERASERGAGGYCEFWGSSSQVLLLSLSCGELAMAMAEMPRAGFFLHSLLFL